MLAGVIFERLKSYPRPELDGRDISFLRTHDSEQFCNFRFLIPVLNWQLLISVWTYVIGLSCLLRTILEWGKSPPNMNIAVWGLDQKERSFLNPVPKGALWCAPLFCVALTLNCVRSTVQVWNRGWPVAIDKVTFLKCTFWLYTTNLRNHLQPSRRIPQAANKT